MNKTPLIGTLASGEYISNTDFGGHIQTNTYMLLLRQYSLGLEDLLGLNEYSLQNFLYSFPANDKH